MGMTHADYVEHLRELQTRLNLTHWEIYLVPGWGSDLGEEMAQVVYQQDMREATIRIDASAKEWEIPFLIRHEMLHILMTDLEFIACNGRSVEVMELYNRELERVINQLAEALDDD